MSDLFDKIVSLSKRRGFIFPSCEIYGGLANAYDYGHYGVLLKDNIKNLWFKRFVQDRTDIFRVESSIILNPKVWEASGHVKTFCDVMIEDTVTNKRYRADHLIEDFFHAKGSERNVDGLTPEELQSIIDENGILSPDGNPLSKARKFNLLFETEIGIVEGEGNRAFLRGEIAQGIFLNFKNIMDSLSPKLPFGIAQAGKAFRNEISKGQFTFRTLEFDLMEFEYFFDPENNSWEELFDFWQEKIMDFALECGLDKDKLRFRDHEDFELSHYSKRTIDLEYKFPWGYKEMFALAYRTDFDLKNHQEQSKQNLNYVYPDGKKVTPHVLEPTFGLSRLMTILLMDAYREEDVDGSQRVFLQLPFDLAPVKYAILPLIKKPELIEVANKIYKKLSEKYNCEVHLSGSIGKRYRKQDEIGTPYCITVDFDTLEDGCVTIRNRDTLKQERVSIDEL